MVTMYEINMMKNQKAGEEMKERQVIVTWFTPEEKMPDEDLFYVVTFSGKDGNQHYENAIGTGAWYSDGWYIIGLSEDADFTVHAWADLDPFGGTK